MEDKQQKNNNNNNNAGGCSTEDAIPLAIVYCRVSSLVQKTEGVSLDVQEQTCVEFCAQKGWKVIRVVREVCSATRLKNQKSLLRVSAASFTSARLTTTTVAASSRKDDDNNNNHTPLSDASATAHTVPTDGDQENDAPQAVVGERRLVVYNVSRFSRNVSQGLEFARKLLTRHGIQLTSCIDSVDLTSNSGEYVLTQLLNAAEFESKLIGKRVADALAKKKAQGNKLGRAPYGYRAVLVSPDQAVVDSAASSHHHTSSDPSQEKQQQVRVFQRDEYEQSVIRFVTLCRTRGTSYDDLNAAVSKIAKIDAEVALELNPPSESLLDALDYNNIVGLLHSYGVFTRNNKPWTARSLSRLCAANLSLEHSTTSRQPQQHKNKPKAGGRDRTFP